MGSKPKDITGQKIGRLTVIEDTGKRNETNVVWKCQCDCGNFIETSSRNLGRNTFSCGCLQKERVTKHGNRTRKNTSSTYNSWHSMKNRCLNPKTPNYKEYGGRGIMVCERWIVFENFLADMGERPEGKTLDRIHNDGHYEPSNCKWSTPKEQANNRRNTKLDEEKINEIKRLTSKGWSNRKIANLMNISHQLVSLVNQGKRI